MVLFEWILALVTFFTWTNLSAGQCNTCSVAGLACVSDTQFWLCSGGFINPQFGLLSCNIGQICTATGCTLADSGTAVACPVCNTCNTANLACVSPTGYVPCLSGIVLPIQPITCPTGTLCYPGGLTSTDICRAPSTAAMPMCGVIPGTTITTQTTTTTVAPTALTAASLYCQSLQILGRFPVPFDSTCKSYYFCVDPYGNGTIAGGKYECPGATFFNPISRVCGTTYQCT